MPRNSVEVLREIRALPAVSTALEEADRCWSVELKRYIEGLPSRGEMPKPKAVKDAVWGMINLTGSEILVIDSPVFQRLRRVKQLGTTFFTFPTADYARFEHGLGVMHQSTRMLRAIEERSDNGSTMRDALPAARLASLLHDLGHFPLSHLSERHFVAYPDTLLEAAKTTIEERLDVDLQLSELMSFLIIQSEAFRSFLIDNARYDAEDVDSASLAIIGSPPPERKFLKQIVSNVIDADKLDYMFRDSKYTSVPLPVDLDRLLYKLKLLPEGARTSKGVDAGGLLAVDIGGVHLIEDLIVGRRILSRQVYHHHKTRAAEQLVLDILSLARPPPFKLIREDDQYFFSAPPTAFEGEKQSLLNRLCESLKFRQLPRRAFAYSHGFLPRTEDEPGEAELTEDLKIADRRFRQDLMLASERRRMGDETHAKFLEITSILKAHRDEVTRFYFDEIKGLKRTPTELFVERPDKTIDPYQSFAPNAAAFAHSPEDFAYVFFSGKKDAGEVAYVAVEAVLFRQYGVRYTRESADLAKINYAEVGRIKHALEARQPSFFDECRALRPQGVYMRSSQRVAELSRLEAQLRGFRTKPTQETILAYLDQFPDGLVPLMVRVLNRVQYINDIEAAGTFKKMLDESDLKDSYLVPLTHLGESSSLMSYFLRLKGCKVGTLEEAKQEKASAITFFEDSVLSGKQARSVVQCWYGMEPDSADDRGTALTPEFQQWLREVKVSFGFYVKRDRGVSSLRALLKELQIGDKGGTECQIFSALGDSSALADVGTEDEMKPLKDFLTEVGTELLRSTKSASDGEKWTPKRCREYALGYSGAEGLTVFAQNVPTSTLTPLWLGGTYKGYPWIPLFQRIDPQQLRSSLEVQAQ